MNNNMIHKLKKNKPIKFEDNGENQVYYSYKQSLYPVDIGVFINSYHNPRSEKVRATTYSQYNEGEFVIGLYKEFLDSPPAEQNGVITHEAFHILENIGEYIGDTFTNETGAYLIQEIVENIHNYINEQQ